MMNMIDKDVLKQRINTAFWSEIENIIDSAPSIDIVSCKDCKYGQDDLFHMFYAYHHHKMYADDFCSYGERREP